MIDKVLLNTRTLLLVYFVVLTAGCWADIPLQQPSPKGAEVKTPSSNNLQDGVRCSDAIGSAPKKVAMLHIGMENPAQSRLFPQLQELLSQRLLQRAQQESPQHYRNATHLTLQAEQLSLLGTANPDINTQVREIGRQTDSQLIVQGTISKIELSQHYNPEDHRDSHVLNNISVALEQVTEQLAAISWRKVTIKLQLFDGYSGNILSESEVSQDISLKSGEPFFLIAQVIDQKKYEARMIEALDALISKQIEIIDEVASCTTLRGRVLTADNITATIDLGQRAQIHEGDQLEIIQTRLIHTDANGLEHMVEEKIATLTVTGVQPDSASGRIENLSRSAEVRRGDLVIAR